ncbi:protein transport protein HofC [Rahnella bonaserana]|jgi:protein transport protein HofC|uniref:Protein transport protein HofC n=1 Tax=Rahnella bonaserana TaxID=2816248 RepID=A0ABS6LZJ6_9GAMM|nr:protein transport protein HofC [Rahnella bonaserana]MBU9857508.1 protein transport protein HofC [Rahnella bonaserana]MCL9643286.1 protein transport protein HofC [Rahnella victoriana]WHZ40060.1 protein transport protein HofC [Rahnella bonaserana]
MSDTGAGSKEWRLYQWQAVDTLGSIQQGNSIEINKDIIYQQLFAAGLQPVSIRMKQRLRRHFWKNQERVAFVRQLATLLQAGLPLMNSLTLLGNEHTKPAWNCVLLNIAKGVREGKPLSEMLGQYPDTFPDIYRQIISIGELTGQLDKCCLQLATQQEQQAELRDKVKKALRYPLLVSAIATIVTLLMLTLVLPEFAKIYASFDAKLPWFTQMLINTSEALITTGPWIAGGLLLCCFGYLQKMHPHIHWKLREQRLLLRLPLTSRLVTDSSLGQIFQTLAMTQQAGMTLIAGLAAASASVSNLHFQAALSQIREQIIQGIPLHKAFVQSPLFPTLCHQLIKIGEESGSLDELLQKLAQLHNHKANSLADTLSQTIEPVLMAVMGIIVGGLVIAMYLPIFQLGSVMG